MNIGDRILEAFNRFLIRMMEDHNNFIQLPDGTTLTRNTDEFAAWVRHEGWHLYLYGGTAEPCAPRNANPIRILR